MKNSASPVAREVSKSYIVKVRGLHNELENVTYITPHLNRGFSGTRNKGDIYPFSCAGPERRVLLIQPRV